AETLPLGRIALSPNLKEMVGLLRQKGGQQLAILSNVKSRNAEVLTSFENRLGDASHRFAFSPDGKLFAMFKDGRVRLFDLMQKSERPTTVQYAYSFLGFVDNGRAIGAVDLGSS